MPVIPLLLTALLLTPTNPPEELIGITWDGEVVSIETPTGVTTLIGDTGDVSLDSLAIDAQQRLLTNTVGPGHHGLQEISPFDGSAVWAGNPCRGTDAMAFSPGSTNLLYIVDDSDRLWLRDLNDEACASTQLIGVLTLRNVRGMTFDANGVLWGWSSSYGLITIDPATAVCTNISGLIDGSTDIQGIAFAGNGWLYGAYDHLFVINTVTGEDVQVSTNPTGYSIRGIEFYPHHIARWKNYGEGHRGSFGIPRIELDQAPVLGRSVNLFIGNTSGGPTPGILVFGLASAETPTHLGGTLLVNPHLTISYPATVGGNTIPVLLPTNPALSESSVYLQAVHRDINASHGWAFTRGLEVTLGLYD